MKELRNKWNKFEIIEWNLINYTSNYWSLIQVWEFHNPTLGLRLQVNKGTQK